jgi:pimeloyl-ACP methyl ester carboxylesterase
MATSCMLFTCPRGQALQPRLFLPTLLIHGTADTVVPIEMGRTLAKWLPFVTVEWVSGANHNDLYDLGGPDLIRRIAVFSKKQI